MARLPSGPVVIDAAQGVTSCRLRVGAIGTVGLTSGDQNADEAAVFVHGNPGSSADWVQLVAAVGEFGRAVALDMPGFGHADKTRHFEHTVSGHARFLGTALDQLGVRRAHLVLHDFGGPWGLFWAALNPAAVASVTLINTGVLIGYRWHAMARVWRTPVLGELFQALTTRAGFRTLINFQNRRRLPESFLNRMYDDFDRDTRRAVLRLYRATSSHGMEALVPALREIDPPTLVIWGTRDPYLPVEQARRQQFAFPRADIKMLAGTGHWPFADDPDRLADLVVPYLRSAIAGELLSTRPPTVGKDRP